MQRRRRRRTIRAIPTVNFHGESRRNDTHQSTTDPDALLARKGNGREAKLSYAGHVLLDNRHGLVANVCVTAATGTAEREAAARRSAPRRHRRRRQGLRRVQLCGGGPRPRRDTPCGPKGKYTAIDGRTTRHPGYAISQQKRKLIEQVFGWMKTIGGLRKLRHCAGGPGRLDRGL